MSENAPEVTEPSDLGMNIFEIYETDSSAEEDGKWFNDAFGERAKGDMKLRGFGARVSMEVRRRLDVQFRRFAKADGTFPPDIQKKIVVEQLAQAIIVDWRGPAFRDKDGKDIPYSMDAARHLLDKMPHFRLRVASMAGELDNFRNGTAEDAVKN